ncbi:MAG: hypothetical protein COB85_05505 [Bacteroidetes bacterium]|nr:MAG: hypothetical protein COB85_05505 [Bacteroidota bacterium]
MQTVEVNTGIVKDEFPTLQSNELQIWKASLTPGKTMLDLCKSALSQQELDRIPYFKFEQVQNNFIVSQGTLRLLLGNYLDIDPIDVRIGRRDKGKPFSINDSSLNFNISNSGGICVFSFSYVGEMGIDIEKIRQLPDLEELIRKNYSNSEIGYINKKDDERLTRFFRLWTVKESYLKAIGEGMRLTPDSLEFSMASNGIKLHAVRGVVEVDDWIFEEFVPEEGYVGTLTYKEEQTKILEIRSLDSSDIFN